MHTPEYLTNHFLIAMPGLADPNFYRTVTYICEHNENGALGIVINRPLATRLGDIFDALEIRSSAPAIAQQAVYMGGPVQPERGFVVHRPLGDWDATLKITDDIGISSSRDILAAIATGAGPQRCLIALGYAGWAAGQLEQEMVENAWLSGPADERVLFDVSVEQRWSAAAQLLGVDLNLLSSDTGHA